jgi:hypothetical protein
MTMGTASGGPPVFLRAPPVVGSVVEFAVVLALADALAVALALALPSE